MRLQKLFGPMPIGHNANILPKYLGKQSKTEKAFSPIVFKVNTWRFLDDSVSTIWRLPDILSVWYFRSGVLKERRTLKKGYIVNDKRIFDTSLLIIHISILHTDLINLIKNLIGNASHETILKTILYRYGPTI